MSSKWGAGHPKAIEKRERTANQKSATFSAKQKAKEDAYWHDENLEQQKKDNRANEKEEKRQAEIARKAELKKLHDEEMAGYSNKPTSKNRKISHNGPGNKKLTKAQLAQRAAMAELQRLEAKKEADKNKGGAFVMVDEEELEENTNRAEAQRIKDEGIIEARNIDQAILALDSSTKTMTLTDGSTVIQTGKVDRHPEKRMKSAYKEFEDQRYQELKAENPSLKMSQLRQMIRKEWKKSPQNPMNQQ